MAIIKMDGGVIRVRVARRVDQFKRRRARNVNKRSRLLYIYCTTVSVPEAGAKKTNKQNDPK